MTDKLTEVQQLAKALIELYIEFGPEDCKKAAEELTRLHAENEALRGQLPKCPRCGQVAPAEIHTCSPWRKFTEIELMEIRPGPIQVVRREWQGLTDKEIEAIEEEYIVDFRIPAGSAWNFARAIEAALKEKNV